MADLKIGSTAASLVFDTRPGAVAAPKKSDRLHDAAQQFEALMIGEMMKSVRQSSESGWLGTSGEDASTDQAVEMAESHFAKALAMSGGFGLSKLVENTVQQQETQIQSGSGLKRSQ